MSREGFQEAGEACDSCKARWESKGMEPMILIQVPGDTLTYHEKVVVCPYCDGPTADIALENSIPKKKK